MIKPLRILSFLLLLAGPAAAQQVFTEGTITYSVSIQPAQASPAEARPAGTYTISIKGQQLRKDLKLDNGFHQVMLINGGTQTAYSLLGAKGRRLAVQLRLSELRERFKRYDRFRMEQIEGGTVAIAGMPTVAARVIYPDQQISEIRYNPDWSLQEPDVFDYFPAITVIPLRFEYHAEDGSVMRFTATRFNAGPVGNALFRIPADHKIMTNEDYKMINK